MESNGRSKEEIASAERTVRDQQSAKRTYKIEYSYDANHFYYAEFSLDGPANDEAKGRKIVYYNGKNTLILFDRALYISEGRNFRFIEFLPMVGVKLFDVPIVVERSGTGQNSAENSCGVFVRQYLDNKKLAIYVPGYCKIHSDSNGLTLLEATIGTPEAPIQRYSFHDYGTLNGVTLAKRGVFSDFFEQTKNGKPANIPAVRTEYRVANWSAKYSGFTAKDLQELLRVNDPVFFEQEGRKIRAMNFSFKDPELSKYFEESSESNLLNRVVLGVTVSACVWSGAVALRSVRRRAQKA